MGFLSICTSPLYSFIVHVCAVRTVALVINKVNESPKR